MVVSPESLMDFAHSEELPYQTVRKYKTGKERSMDGDTRHLAEATKAQELQFLSIPCNYYSLPQQNVLKQTINHNSITQQA